MIENDENLENEVISCIKRKYDDSYLYMQCKLWDRQYMDNLEKNTIMDGKIKTQDMQQARKLFVSRMLWERMSPSFVPVDGSGFEIAQKLWQFAKFDSQAMRKNIKDKEVAESLFNYGVSIEMFEYFDMHNVIPAYKIVNPKAWLPDPQGNTIDNNFSYHMFAVMVTKWQLREANERAINNWSEEIFHDIDELCSGSSYIEQATRYTDKANRSLMVANETDEIYVLHCYITLWANRYIVTLWNAHNEIIRWEHLQPIGKAEKKNQSLVPFPIAVTNVYPLDIDPCGVSPRELMYDMATAMNKIANSIYIKELNNAGADIIFYDDSRIRNADDINNKRLWAPLYVPYDGSQSQWPIVQKLNDFQDTGSSMNYFAWLRNKAQENTGITNVLMWLPDANNTLWQMNQQIQQADNVFDLDIEMMIVWQSFFWKNIWMRSLRQNIKEVGKKVNTVFWQYGSYSLLKLETSDFVWSEDPNVIVVSKKQQMKLDAPKVAQMEAFLPLMMQDPNVKPIDIKFFKREMYRKKWFDDEDIYLNLWLDLDANEMHSMDMMNIINLWEIPKTLFRPWLDLHTLRKYVMMCNNNDAKQRVMMLLDQRIIEEWLAKPVEKVPWMEWMANSMGSQMTSNLLSNNQQWVQNQQSQLS